ncbi:hypothetical protein Tsubulata_032470 [Turnera subulata]|uniref:Uncharacterized protein n=1 Tax=Turnera subulata TaxID=218843 RepID=A0A9Q0JGC4_9ROSI|nr:hypothetical protein Tsubulata_032470 [Turnera subulata]
MVTPAPTIGKTSKSKELPENVQKTIEECSPKISVNNGNLLKESLLGKGNPSNEVCLALINFGKTCHVAFTKLMISKKPAADESKIWARSKSNWKYCSRDVSDNPPEISSSLTQTLLECGPKIEEKYGVQIRDNLLGKVKLNREACVILIRWGERCHLAFSEFLISKERDQDPSTVRERSKAAWKYCDQTRLPSTIYHLEMEAFASLLVDVKSLESSLPKNGFSLEWCSHATDVLRKMHSHFKFLIINKKFIKVPKFDNDKNYYEEYSNECENLMEFCNMIKLAISRMDRYHLMV